MRKARQKVWMTAVCTIAAIAACGALGTAHARVVGGGAGRAVPPGDKTCFADAMAGVAQVCSGTRSWDMSLATDGQGSKNVTVTARGPSSQYNVGCQAVSRNPNNTGGYTSGSYKYLTSFGSAVDIAMSVYVGQNYQLYVNCLMDQSTYLHTVHWTI